MSVIKMALITIGAIFVLCLSVFAAYRYSQNKSGGLILPAGTTYLGATPTPQNHPPTGGSPTTVPSKPPLRFKADPSVALKEFTGSIFPYSFSYPETLPLMVFTDDPTDSVAISWEDKPPQQNILLNVENIVKKDKSYITKPKKEYVNDWWESFSGLKGVSEVKPFTNINGMKGYKAKFINTVNESPNLDIFFEVPQKPDIMIHLANGILDPAIFDKIIDSVAWNEKNP